MPIISNKSDRSLPSYRQTKVKKIRKFSINERHNTFEKIRHHGRGNYSKFHVANSKLIEELIADHFIQIGPQLAELLQTKIKYTKIIDNRKTQHFRKNL